MNDKIREAVKQWRTKAEGDWTTVEILLKSELCPHDAVCFHCQQLVEKLLKALLTAHSVETPKTHDLRRLIQLAEPFAPGLSSLADASDTLTIHGVETRYPGNCEAVGTEEMNDIVKLAKKFRDMLLAELDRLDSFES